MLRRYLFRELGAPLLAWTGFLFLMFFVIAFLRGTEVLLGSGVTALDVASFAAYLTPQFLVQALPIALLLALLLGLGRLSEDGELKALQSLGVSPRAFFAAPLLLGLAITGALVLLAFTLQPWGMASVRKAGNDILRRNLMSDVKAGVFHEEVTGFTLYAEQVEPGGRWRHVLLFDGRDQQSPLLVVAKAGGVRPAIWEDALAFDLEAGSIHRATRSTDEYVTIDFERGTFRAAVGDSFRRNRLMSPREEWTPLELYRAAGEAEARGESPLPLAVSFHWRLGQLLMPLAFALFGAPLALVRRGSGRARGFLLTLAGFVAYYLLARTGVQLGEKGQLPVLLAGQLANLAFTAAGLALMWLVGKRGVA